MIPKVTRRICADRMLRIRCYLSHFRYLGTCAGGNAQEQQRRGLASEEGATLVEMALSATVVFLLLIGIVQTSMALFTYHYVSDAAREGARYVIVRGSTSCTNTPKLPDCNDTTGTGISNYVKGIGYPGIDSSKMTVATTWCQVTQNAGPPPTATWGTCASGVSNAPGNQVQVVVTYHFTLSIPWWGSQLWPLTSTSNMVISQ